MNRTNLPSIGMLSLAMLFVGACYHDRPHETGQARPPVESLDARDAGLQSKDVVVASDQMAQDLLALPELNESKHQWTTVVDRVENRTTGDHFDMNIFLERLKVNLAKQGQQQAIHVIPDYDNPGTYFVSDGGRRVRALKEANKDTVKAIVIYLPIGIQSYKLGYDLNVQRDSQTVFDNAVVWRRFLEDKHFQSQKELAEHLGLDESTVAVALSIAKLPEVVMQEMVTRPDRFGTNMGYQVGRYHTARGTDATLRLINKILSDDLSTRQVADIVKGRVSAQETAKPAGRQRYAQRLEIKFDGVSVGDLKSYGDDRIELKLRGLSRDKRDAILHQIEQMLQQKGE